MTYKNRATIFPPQLAITDEFVNQEIILTTVSTTSQQPSLRLTGTLSETPSLSGRYNVQVGDDDMNRFDFTLGNVDAVWQAASGRIVRVRI